MKQASKTHWIFGIIGLMVLYTAPAVAAPVMGAPPGGLNVHVVNPSDDPVPVTIQGQPPAPQPYQQEEGDAGNDITSVSTDFPTVPDGYRLEIHDVAGLIEASRGDPGAIPRIVRCSLSVQGNQADFIQRTIPAGDPIKGSDQAQAQVVSESVLMYVPAGDHPSLRCDATGSVPHMQFLAYIAGVLVLVVD